MLGCYDTAGVVTTFCDTMIGGPGHNFLTKQDGWMIQHSQMANGVSEANNMEDENLALT